MGGDANIARDEAAASALGERRDPGYARIPFPPRRQSPGPLSRVDRIENAFLRSRVGQAWMRSFRRRRPGSWVRNRVFVNGVLLTLRTLLAFDRAGLAVYYEEDAEIAVPQWPGLAESYVGPEGFMDFFEAWTESWDQIELEVREVYDLGDSSVVFGWMYTRGGASGVATRQPFSSFHEYGPAKMSRGEWYMTWEEGLAAAGLEGEPLPE
jgi:ketosteroid isomerase-like protein